MGGALRKFALFATLLGCGGQVERVDDSPASSEDGCTRACDRMLTTCTSNTSGAASCVTSCETDFDADPDAARRYAACLEALPCSEIEGGLYMSFGPIGECYVSARHNR